MKKLNRLLVKVLWRHVSLGQILGFTLANLVGLVILLLGLQFYHDARGILESKRGFLEGDYIVISKPVSTLGALRGSVGSFSEREQGVIARQPFVSAVGQFTPARFEVTAGVDLGMSVYTYMFLEAVPNSFLDLSPEQWTAEEAGGTLPIIIPRSYLALYNSAFSQSQGLPQISERSMGLVPLRIEIRGGGVREVYQGRIVGFSDRLNTILVPERFIRETNERLAPEADTSPTRLILRVDNPADPALLSFLRERDYTVEGNALETGEANYILRLVAGIVLLVGGIISVLSLYLLVLSVYLILEKNTAQIETLLLLGYSPHAVALPYQLLCLGLEIGVLMLSWGIVYVLRGYYIEPLGRIFPDEMMGAGWAMYVYGLVIVAVMVVTTAVAIARRVGQIPAFGRR